MSARHTTPDGLDWHARYTNMLSVAELLDVLARYKADDNSWPRGLVHLRSAIIEAEAATRRAHMQWVCHRQQKHLTVRDWALQCLVRRKSQSGSIPGRVRKG
jgi:hypothetical protein